jgi:hypothetical protein
MESVKLNQGKVNVNGRTLNFVRFTGNTMYATYVNSNGNLCTIVQPVKKIIVR